MKLPSKFNVYKFVRWRFWASASILEGILHLILGEKLSGRCKWSSILGWMLYEIEHVDPWMRKHGWIPDGKSKVGD